LNGRERILAAAEHREPDRIPIDFGGSMVTSIHEQGYNKLKKHLGILPDRETEIARGRSLVARVDPEVQDALGVDTRMLIVNSPDGWDETPKERGKVLDEWGIEWEMPKGFSNYEITRAPFAGDVTLNDIRAYPWPEPMSPRFAEGLKGLRESALRLRKSTDKAVVANLAVQIHTQSYFMRGLTDYLMDMAVNPGLIEAIQDRVLEIFEERARKIMDEVGDLVDVVYVADDLGMQTGPLFSLEMYRRTLKPRQKRLFETIKRGSDVKILYHTCGSVVEFIDDLAEVGIDILNPVQVTAKGMDTRKLKKRFGEKICFWGGIDTQEVLPFGTPSQVREEVKRRLDDLAAGGGYVLAAVHNIRPEVPPENIVAMIESARELGVY